MRNIIFSMLATSFLLMLAVWNTTALGQTVSLKELGPIPNDIYLDTMIARTGTYDPCCNGLDWRVQFYRTAATSPTYYLRFHFNGTSIHRQYRSDQVAREQTHAFYGQSNEGPSTSHEIVISKSLISSYGCFEDMYAKAAYYTPNIDRHEGP
ncbi:MAG: hypothetical protein A2W25_00700 [candidate division Zixibacteria bacterium RBG_16_53_22]|nr:MAG: hypothetical protein A2W25_00700 [candidate division Zixibacteria bacterium RBG_16_53_22]